MKMHRRARISFTLLSFLAVLAGCQDSVLEPPLDGEIDVRTGHALLDAGSQVTLRAEADAFAPGAPVTLVLENGSADQVGFNLCFHGVERRTGGQWVSLTDSRICTAHLNLLGPGGAARYETVLPDSPGEYRFRVGLYLMDRNDHRDQVSAAFTIG